MQDSMKKKTSSVIIMFLLSLIIISFVFSGYQASTLNTNNIAEVGPYPITSKEFGLVASNSRTKDGAEAGQEEIFNQIVRQKINYHFARELGILPSQDNVADLIREYPAFKNKNEFDTEVYKKTLLANRLTPHDFESFMAENIALSKLQRAISLLPYSKTTDKVLAPLKNEGFVSNVLMVSHKNIRDHYKISKEKISAFIINNKNDEKLKKYFHTFPQVFEKNDKIVKDLKKYPSQWRKYRWKIAQEILRKEVPTTELTQNWEETFQNARKLLESNKITELRKMNKAGKISFHKDVLINYLGDGLGSYRFDQNKLAQIFTPNQVLSQPLVFNDPTNKVVVILNKRQSSSPKDSNNNNKEESLITSNNPMLQFEKYIYQQKIYEEIYQVFNKKLAIKRFVKFN